MLQMIADVNLTFLRQDCTEATTQDNNSKQELTGKEDRERECRPALGKEAKQYWTMLWIIACHELEKRDEIIPNNAVKQS